MTLEVLKDESVQGPLTPNEAYKELCKLMQGEPLLGAERRERVIEFLEDIMGYSDVVGVVETSLIQGAGDPSQNYGEILDSDDPTGIVRATDIAIAARRAGGGHIMIDKTDFDIFSDDSWLDRELDREVEGLDFREGIIEDNHLWEVPGDETQLEVEWHNTSLDAINEAEVLLRTGGAISWETAYKIAKDSTARNLTTDLGGRAYLDGDTLVMPTMITNYVHDEIMQLIAGGE